MGGVIDMDNLLFGSPLLRSHWIQHIEKNAEEQERERESRRWHARLHFVYILD